MTTEELFALFERPVTETRWVASADSAEYLNKVIYLTQRYSREAST